jgi:Ca2+-binding EF-hand superfamily protein
MIEAARRRQKELDAMTPRQREIWRNNQIAVRKRTEKLLDIIRSQMKKKSITAGHLFSFMDADKSGTATFMEFQKGLWEAGIEVNPEVRREIFSLFDSERSRTIELRELKQRLEVRESATGMHGILSQS